MKIKSTEDLKYKLVNGTKFPNVSFDELAIAAHITPEVMNRTYNKISGSCLHCGYQHFTENWDCKNCLALTKLEGICD